MGQIRMNFGTVALWRFTTEHLVSVMQTGITRLYEILPGGRCISRLAIEGKFSSHDKHAAQCKDYLADDIGNAVVLGSGSIIESCKSIN